MIDVGAQLRVAESQANDVVTRLFPLHDPDLLEHLRLHWAKPWAGIGKRWLRHPFYQDIDTVRDYFRRAHCLLLRVARVPCESCRYALGPELEQLPPIHGHARRCSVVLWWCEHNLVCADIGKPTFPCKVALAPSTSGKSAASRLRRTESASVFSLICSTLLGGPLRLGKGDGGLEAALALDAEAGARVALWGLAAEGLCEPA